jgi:uncharacterized UBP type Zn finger protein
MAESCTHMAQRQEVTPQSETCEHCKETGDTPVALRMCLVCGHVGCCDSTPGMHANKHFEETGHPIMQAYKSTKRDFNWCYVDKAYV